jgi:SAM-dependent methyltransferase
VATFKKFELRAPAAQNLIDIFPGKWASDFTRVAPGLQAGTVDLFVSDPRPLMAARYLGANERLQDMEILELGPLEAGHTYRLEQLGAIVTAVEANREAYLKCLLVKELLNLKKSRFLLGDFLLFLEETDRNFDLIFASGVLYHMPDPLRLVEQIAKRTRKCFVWSHYYDRDHYPGPRRKPRTVNHSLGNFTYYELGYPNMGYRRFWGGNTPVASWLSKEEILSAFRLFGFDQIEIIDEQTNHPHGACMSFAARRS